MLRKNLLQLVFSGAYLLRWNDKLRPTELWEIDKQGHKMLLAFMLWQEQTRDLAVERAVALGQEVIEGGLFDYLYRMIITDLKPPVFYSIKKNPAHYKELTAYVLRCLEPAVKPLGEEFWGRLCAWHTQDTPQAAPQYGYGAGGSLARRILDAAHLYASQWEFKLIGPLNPFDEEIPDIAATFTRQLAGFGDIAGMDKVLDNQSALGKMANLCGQLRFQIRWTKAPRIPATSVLGHMFLVATYSYFASLVVGACQARRNNNYFCGLLHDLPELLTRDIITPVKRSVATLPELIKDYENQELERRIFAPLREEGYTRLVDAMHYHLGLYTGSEFDQSIRLEDGKCVRIPDFETLHREYNNDCYNPRDGALVKNCDLLAAFMEAHSSICNGVASPHLLEAQARLRSELMHKGVPALHLDALLGDFD